MKLNDELPPAVLEELELLEVYLAVVLEMLGGSLGRFDPSGVSSRY